MLEPVNIICPICGNGNYMRHLSGKGVGLLDVKCINCNSYFSYEELYKQRTGEASKPKPITNADRIRAMSDEEMAEVIWGCGDCDTCYLYHKGCNMNTSCKEAVLEWLKKESE